MPARLRVLNGDAGNVRRRRDRWESNLDEEQQKKKIIRRLYCREDHFVKLHRVADSAARRAVY